MTDKSKTIPSAVIIFIATALAYAMVGARNAGIAYQYKLPWNSVPVELNSLLIILVPIVAIGSYLYLIDSIFFMQFAHLNPSLRFRLIITIRSLLVFFALLYASLGTIFFWVILLLGSYTVLSNAWVEFIMPYRKHKEIEGYINRLKAQDKIDDAAVESGYSPSANLNAKFGSWISIYHNSLFLILVSFLFGMSITAKKQDYYFLDCLHSQIVLAQTDKKVIAAKYDEQNNIIKYPIQILTNFDSISFYFKTLDEPPKSFKNKIINKESS